MAVFPLLLTTFQRPKHFLIILDLPERFLTVDSKISTVPGIRSESKGETRKVAPESTTMGVEAGVVTRIRGSGFEKGSLLAVILQDNPNGGHGGEGNGGATPP